MKCYLQLLLLSLLLLLHFLSFLLICFYSFFIFILFLFSSFYFFYFFHYYNCFFFNRGWTSHGQWTRLFWPSSKIYLHVFNLVTRRPCITHLLLVNHFQCAFKCTLDVFRASKCGISYIFRWYSIHKPILVTIFISSSYKIIK